jgi:hypothetical protein
MNIQLAAPVPSSPKRSPTQKKRSKRRSTKRTKHSKRGSTKRTKHSKRSHKSSRKSESSRRSKKRRNTNEYNIQNQINQFYQMTLAHLSQDQKGFLDISDNTITFTGSIAMTELQQMPWMPNLKDVKQKMPIASPLLLGPFTFKLTFSQANKTKEVERRLTIQNGTICLVKDLLLNLKVNCP